MLTMAMNTLVFISWLLVIMPMPAMKASQRVHHGSALNLAGSQIDAAALIAFKKGILSDPSGVMLNWDSERNHLCNWTGVQCNIRKWRVTGLDVRNMSLQGTIPSHLGNLSFLQYLDLSLNRLGGHIPPALGGLGRLKVLFLNRNMLEGPIPSTLGDCLRLTELHLSKNNFQGSIPHQMGQLRSLRVLSSWGSGLTGIIPPALGNCSMLQLIDLSENNLTGRIPFQLGFLTRLQRLQLDQNHLTGRIPPHLLNCTGLRNLSMFYNRLSGAIPPHIGAALPNLQRLVMSGNKLSGRIPKSLANCSQLSLLELASNELTGIIPAELGNLINLEVFDLNSNRLVSGSSAAMPILDALSNCSKLRRLDLSINHLTGTLPKIVGRLSPNLTYLSLERNRFEGKIPEEIGNLTALIELYLSYNLLVGSIPSAMGRLLNLHVISLNANKLEGNIPSEFGRMESLEFVYVSENRLSGAIPKSLGRLGELREIDLSVNQLSGTIPPEIGNWVSVEVLDVSHNTLSGNIPSELGNIGDLQLYLNLSNNMLTGSVPAELGRMQMVQAIDLSANKFSGSIPSGISSCVELQYLNLSHNQLGGKLLESIWPELRSLQNIDLSFNKISGPIPSSMAKMAMLSRLNLSYNSLAGAVPCEGAFQNVSITSFFGNPQLCGNCWGKASCFDSSKTQQRRASRKKKKIVLIVTIVSIFALCCFGLGFWICLRTSKGIPSKSNSLRPGKIEFSKEELSRATDDYHPRNLIGVGSYGSVYRGVLPGGKTVAVKVLTNWNVEQAQKCFHQEFQTLSSVRHPNLVKIIGSCSAPEFRALVLKFMSNGSLDKHLHREHQDGNSQNDQVLTLSLKMRLSILCDVARGISYLHHVCRPSIVHCDLKPQNVLLDESLRARVADFGIARLSKGGDEASTATSTFRGSIGYVPPEYGLGGRVWSRGDVYSYGIVVLEMITGKRPTDEMFGGQGLTLPRWVSLAFPLRLEEVIQRSLLSTTNECLACIRVLAQLGLWCTCETPESRPTMQRIEEILETQLDTLSSIEWTISA